MRPFRFFYLVAFVSLIMSMSSCLKGGDDNRVSTFTNVPGTIVFDDAIYIITDDNVKIRPKSNANIPMDGRVLFDFVMASEEQTSPEYLLVDVTKVAELPLKETNRLQEGETFDTYGVAPLSYMSQQAMMFGRGYITVCPSVLISSKEAANLHTLNLVYDEENSNDSTKEYVFELRHDASTDTEGKTSYQMFFSFNANSILDWKEDMTIRLKVKTITGGGTPSDDVIEYKYKAPYTEGGDKE